MEEDLQRRITAAYREAFPDDGRRLVFGEGPFCCPGLMLIGEAPGAQEEQQGRPFVGKAGKNLDEFLQIVGLERREIYISNTVKVRPFRISPKGTTANRPPNRAELSFFRPFLLEEIRLVRPGIVVTLGNTALQSLVDDSIGSCHGQLIRTDVQGMPLRLFPLYHPASIIYNRSLTVVYHSDLIALKEVLSAPC